MLTFPARGLAAALLATALALAAAAHARTIIREVEVNADIDALQNIEAATRWTRLADDLGTAIVSRPIGRTGEDGARLSVDIDEVALADSLQAAGSIAESRLAGTVNLRHDTDSRIFDNHELSITLSQVTPALLPGTGLAELTPDSEDDCTTRIAAFADGVAERLQQGARRVGPFSVATGVPATPSRRGTRHGRLRRLRQRPGMAGR